jgi:hypothetical protein
MSPIPLKEKVSYVCEINCPFCHENIKVLKKTKTFQEAVKAEKEDEYFAEKGSQTKLFEETKP